MTDLEKALQYFIIAVPENEEMSKAYFWARRALNAYTQPSAKDERTEREAWEPCRYCGNAPFMDGVELKPCASGYMGVEATVGKCRDDEAVGMVIYYRNAAAGYLDFAYCPFCGRPQTEEAWRKLENQLKGVRQIGEYQHEEKPSTPAL